jgi:hypothetical protein
MRLACKISFRPKTASAKNLELQLMVRSTRLRVDSFSAARWVCAVESGFCSARQNEQYFARSLQSSSLLRSVASHFTERAQFRPQRSPAPESEPVNATDLEKLTNFLCGNKNVLVITGAGCSTESNIPDYRGPLGAYTSGFKPMSHQQVCCACDHWPAYFPPVRQQ